MRDLFKLEFSLIKHLNLQPSEIEQMPFYRVEYLMEDLKEYLEEQRKKEEEQSGGMDKNDYMKQSKGLMSDAQKSMGKYAPKIPSLPSGGW